MNINPKDFIPKFDAFLSRGLCSGVGHRDGQMCIEAAICAALDLPHGDAPTCVAHAVRAYKIRLNDCYWSSPEARAKGLRSIGIAQVGSAGVVDDKEFSKRMSEGTIRRLLPTLFREVFPNNQKLLAAADRCELEGSREAVKAARLAAYTVWAAEAAECAAMHGASVAYVAMQAAEVAWCSTNAAAAARMAKEATKSGDKYLLLSADICLQVLKDLKSPGCAWLELL
ncbi:unnamed protein product [Sphagnum tenellum]